jgi:2,3-bisphosphoglycerate-independent phosphoglycerate mutase
MEAIGSGLELKPGEVAARGNFCTIGPDGRIVDRRAGRPADDVTKPVLKLLNTIKVDGGSVTSYPVKEHRFAAIFRGEGLSDDITNTDPEKTDVPASEATPVTPKAEKMARMANEFTRKARQVLAGQPLINMALLRGFSQVPHVPSMTERYKLKPACVAVYPMYRGLSYIVGMDLLNSEGATMADEIDTARRNWDKYDFFFMHFKHADSAGEDFDFDRKVKMLEEVDECIPALRALGPDVIMVAGDHSTPAILGGHSWHPVPFLMHGPFCGNGGIAEFNERACARGMLGRMPARYAMALALANARKLNKFGA